MSNSEFMANFIDNNLRGKTITGAVMAEGGDAFGFTVGVGTEKTIVWVDCDAEGNGPGWLSAEPFA